MLRLRDLEVMALLLLGPALLPAGAGGQVAPRPPDPQAREENLRIFLDCERCDFDYFREEIPFVNFVRDRMDAQLHILVTQQRTGAGGNEYALHFLGLEIYDGRQDTLRYTSLPDETDDETRVGLVRTMRLGLVPYVASTPLGRRLDVRYQGPPRETTAEEADDPWNLWVFRARVSGELEGEERSSDRSMDGSFSASRTTEELKVDLSVRMDYSKQTFELSDGDEVTSASENHEAEGTVVWSLGPHWSFGVMGAAAISTRQNHDLATRVGPALEYNIYPYAEANRRQVTFLYTLELAYFNYEELTLFDKWKETRAEQTLKLAAAFEQPWGEVDASMEWANYLDDFASHRLDVFSRLEVRLFRGLSLDLFGKVARVKNQIYVPREDISDEDVFLERRELGTNWEFSIDIGFSYTFGSVFNNVVNPRMSTSEGGGH